MNYEEIKSIAFGDNSEEVKRKALIDMYWILTPKDLIEYGDFTKEYLLTRWKNLDIDTLEKEVKLSDFNKTNWD